MKTIHDSTAAAISSEVVTISAGLWPMARPKRPATSAPISGRKTIAWIISALALHHVDVLNRDGAAVAEEDHENREPDGGLGGGDGQDQQREHLADEIAQM